MAEAIVGEVSCWYIGRDEVFSVCNAEGSVVFAEDSIGVFGEPALVAELEGETRSIFAQAFVAKKCPQKVGVGFEVGWKLKEDRAEACRFADGRERGEEVGEVRVAVAKAAEVGHALRGFESEEEAVGRGSEPGGCGLGLQVAAEGVVDFDGGEIGSVVRKKGATRDVGGVEAGLPGRVVPTGSAAVEMRWCGCEVLRLKVLRGQSGGLFWCSRQTAGPRS